ncbi:MAG: hypothetical protein ABIS51_11865 [Sphingomonas sp.]
MVAESERLRLAAEGGYPPEFESDACHVSLVVWAIRDGRDVSTAMHGWLKAKAQIGRKAA